MAYSDPNSIHNPSTGTSPPASWGDNLRDNIVWLAGDSASGNPKPMCRVYHNTSQSVATATWTSLAFNSERYDVGTMHSTSTNTSRITIPSGGDGVYSIGGSMQFANGSSTGVRVAGILLNGATYLQTNGFNSVTSDATSVVVQCDYKLAAGDYIQLQAYQTSGGLLNVFSNANYSPEFWCHWVGVG